jgi:hypothetical protein
MGMSLPLYRQELLGTKAQPGRFSGFVSCDEICCDKARRDGLLVSECTAPDPGRKDGTGDSVSLMKWNPNTNAMTDPDEMRENALITIG